MSKITDRAFKNPITTLIGLILVGVGVYVITIPNLDTATQLTIATLLVGGGIVGLGLKDPNNTGTDVNS